MKKCNRCASKNHLKEWPRIFKSRFIWPEWHFHNSAQAQPWQGEPITARRGELENPATSLPHPPFLDTKHGSLHHLCHQARSKSSLLFLVLAPLHDWSSHDHQFRGNWTLDPQTGTVRHSLCVFPPSPNKIADPNPI